MYQYATHFAAFPFAIYIAFALVTAIGIFDLDRFDGLFGVVTRFWKDHYWFRILHGITGVAGAPYYLSVIVDSDHSFSSLRTLVLLMLGIGVFTTGIMLIIRRRLAGEDADTATP